MGHHHNSDHDHEHYYNDTFLHDNQYVFLRHYVRMLETCDEGISYLLKKLNETATFELTMYQDCLDALTAIENANLLAWNLMKKIDISAYDTIRSFDDLKQYLEKVLDYQAAEDMDNVIGILVNDLFPEYLVWSEKVQNALVMYIQQ